MKINELIETATYVIGAVHTITNSERDSEEYGEGYGEWKAIHTVCGILGYQISYSTRITGNGPHFLDVTVQIRSKGTPGVVLNVPEYGNPFITKEKVQVSE